MSRTVATGHPAGTDTHGVSGNPDHRSRFTTVIRPYRPGDRAAVRQICCETAFRHLGATAVFEDQELFADYWTRYYTDFEPDMTFVAEREGQVVGYVFGSIDSRRHVRTMISRVLPQVLARVTWRLATGRYREAVTYRFLRWAVRWAWREAPDLPLDRFPAHYHINASWAGLGEQLYTRLGLTFVDELIRRGGTHLHGVVMEKSQGGVFHRSVTRFLAACPDAQAFVTERPTRFALEVLGDSRPMVNRAFGFAAADFRRLMEWVAVRYGR